MKLLVRTITSPFHLLLDMLNHILINVDFFTSVNIFWIVQNNALVSDTINKLNKRSKKKINLPLIVLFDMLNFHKVKL